MRLGVVFIFFKYYLKKFVLKSTHDSHGSIFSMLIYRVILIGLFSSQTILGEPREALRIEQVRNSAKALEQKIPQFQEVFSYFDPCLFPRVSPRYQVGNLQNVLIVMSLQVVDKSKKENFFEIKLLPMIHVVKQTSFSISHFNKIRQW